jgi:pyridoxal phosphate enzyme (YggS family)
MHDTESRISRVRGQIEAAARAAERDPADVTLLAVTKTRDVATVQAGVDAGLADLGENRVQEAQEKIPRISGNPTWHLIGSLQTNKARRAVELFQVIHSVDRPKLASRLAAAAADLGCRPSIYVQVDFVRSGLTEQEAIQRAMETAGIVAEAADLDLVGLMTLPPFDPDPEAARPWFRRLVAVQSDLASAGIHAPGLSMGMSNDFEVAIQEGATIVRVGTSLFGPRAT